MQLRKMRLDLVIIFYSAPEGKYKRFRLSDLRIEVLRRLTND